MRRVAKPRPRVYGGPRAEDLDQLADMLAKAERPLVWVGGALANAGRDDAGRAAPAGRAMGAAGLPHPSPAAAVRPNHPNYGGYMGIRVPKTDGRDAEGRSAGRHRRAHHQLASASPTPSPNAPDPQLPLVQVWPDPNEIGRVFRPDLGIAARTRRGDPGAAAARRAAGCPEARRLGRRAERHPSQADGAELGAACRMA